MKKLIALFLIFSILALSGNLMAKERRGAELIITKKDGQQVRGELIAVKEKSLLLLVSGVDVSIGISDIIIVRIVKKSKALVGFLEGACVGALLGLVSSKEPEPTDLFGREIAMVPLGIVGGLIGLVFGALAGRDVKIQIGGRPEEEVNIILEYLRSKARYPDYK